MDAFTPLSDDPNDYCFIDSETRTLPGVVGPEGDVTQVGVDVYADNAFATMWTWAIGDDPVECMALHDGFDERLTWELDAPPKLQDFHARVEAGEAWYVAWNMGFDRAIWNGPESDFPRLENRHTLDAMVQASSAGLPGKLEHASRACGFGGKQADGGKLIQIFAPHDGETPQSRPDLWKAFVRYGIRDTDELRKVFLATRMLPAQEWQDYWISEAINQRGLAVDVGFARRAGAVADANVARINAQLVRATNGRIDKVTQAARIRDWVYDRIDNAEAREIMVKAWDTESEDDYKPAKLSLDKPRLEKLIAYYENMDGLEGPDETTLEVLQHRFFGGSSSPAKFHKIVRMQKGGVLRGQYTFNGAGQTGRYSSRGVQIHNLIRKSLGDAESRFMEEVNGLELSGA